MPHENISTELSFYFVNTDYDDPRLMHFSSWFLIP